MPRTQVFFSRIFWVPSMVREDMARHLKGPPITKAFPETLQETLKNNIVKLCCGKVVRKPREDWVLPKLRGLGKKQWSVSRGMGVGIKLEVVPNQPFYKTHINKMIGIGAWQWTCGRHFVRNRFLFFFLVYRCFLGNSTKPPTPPHFYKLKTWHSVSSTPVLFTKCLVQRHLVNVQGDSKGWLIRENLIKMDDLGVPPLSPILGNLQRAMSWWYDEKLQGH